MANDKSARNLKAPATRRSVLLAGALLTLLAACNGNTNPQEAIAEAQKLAAAGKIDAAVIELKNAVRDNPDNADARWLLGNLYLEQGKADAAVKELSRALALGINDAEHGEALIRALVMQRKYDQALEQLAKIPEQEMTASLLVLRAQILAGQGKLGQAETVFEQALGKEKDNSEALIGLARLAMQAGDIETAKARIQRALTADPDNGQAHYIDAELALADGRFEAARSAFTLAEADPRTATLAKLGVARAQAAAGDNEAALQTLSEVLKASPNHPLANYLVGLIHARQEQWQPAKEALQKTLNVLPEHRLALQQMGAVLYQLEQYQQADETLTRLLGLDPTNLTARRLLAATRLKAGDPEGALRAIGSWADDSDDANLLLLAGLAHRATGNQALSAQFLERAAKAAPGNTAIQTQAGLAHLQTGDIDAALSNFAAGGNDENYQRQTQVLVLLSYLRQKNYDQAISAAKNLVLQWPDSAVPLNLLGTAQQASGDVDAARQSFERALKLDPGFLPAGLNLAKLDMSQGNTEAATKRLRALLAQHPGNEQLLVALANIARLDKDFDAMVAYLEQARAAKPEALQARAVLANYLLQTGKTDQALAVAKESVAAAPKNPAVLLLLARAQQAAKANEDALATLDKLASIAGDNPAILTQAALTYRKLGADEKAEAALRSALSQNGDYVPALVVLTQIFLAKEDYAQAADYAKRITQLAPESPEGAAIMGDIAFRKQDYTGAAQAYEKALGVQETRTLVFKLFESLQRANRVKASREVLQSWLEKQPDDMAAMILLANSLLTGDTMKQATALYEKILVKQPNNAAVLNNLAWAYAQSGDTRALDTANRALRAAPDRPEIQDTVGWIKVNVGEITDGLKLLQEAHAASPENPEISYHLAAALVKNGDRAAARSLLEELLARDTQFAQRDQAESLLKSLAK